MTTKRSSNALALVAVLLFLAGLAAAVSAARGADMIVYEAEGTTRQPDGTVVTHPAQSQVDVCYADGIAYVYDPWTRTMFVPQPCNKLFGNGFD